MKIGDLARTTATPIETIRYYEREGLLPTAARTEGNYRIYTEVQAQRLMFIRHCRSLDMTLAEIRILLRFKDAPNDHCDEVNALLDAHIGHVAQRIQGLKHLDQQLKSLRDMCRESHTAMQCGILAELTHAAKNHPQEPPETIGHIQGSHPGGNARKHSRRG